MTRPDRASARWAAPHACATAACNVEASARKVPLPGAPGASMTTRMPRELATSSRSRRTSARKRTSSAVVPVATATDGPVSGADGDPGQEAALSEIRHEVGNFFHKLYYWLDTLRDAPADDPEHTGIRMVEQTVRNLEDFLGTALEYFRPVRIVPVAMTGAEVVAGVRARVRGAVEGVASAVDDDAAVGARMVAVDPGRFSAVLDATLQRLVAQAPAGTPVRIATTRETRDGVPGLALTFALGAGAPPVPAFHTAAAALGWAMAQRVAALHGGELAERAAPDGTRTIVLFLPYHG